ncbi:MAG: heme exporter protein [Thermoanaerobaculia bacterium]|jgi:heme exporter protein A|nr:heme exporter protein [Thermoanaerobaculia bacterium]
MGPSPGIDAHNLARRYGRRWALADVSFSLASGSVMMVAGPNGSGKSTLLRTLATAIRPDAGSASIGGFDLVRDREDVRRLVALLSHSSYLYDSLSAHENLAVVADHLGYSRNRIAALLDRVALSQRANDPVATFSAGMRKRLSFARVLLQEPRVVFLDEPYGQLDPEGFALVDDVVRELKSEGATVVIASHQLPRASSLADEALLLESGRVVWRGKASEVPGR